MSKTPEEMAEEYVRYENESAYWTKHAFLAGYKAAQEQYCEAVKVLEKHKAAAEKAVTNIKNAGDWVTIERLEGNSLDPIINLPTPAKWISVKDRLPEERVWVLGYYSIYENDMYHVGVVQRFVHTWAEANIWLTNHKNGPLTYEEVDLITHWQPLPAVPKEEK